MANMQVWAATSPSRRKPGSALVRAGALGGAGNAQHGQDVAQAKVVVRLLGQLLLAQTVQHEELLAQNLVLLVATRCQLDLCVVVS